MMFIAAVTSSSVAPSLLVAFVVAACISGWWWAVGRVVRHEPILSWQPRRIVPWGFMDIVMGMLILLFVQVCMAQLLSQFGILELAVQIDEMPANHRGLLLAVDSSIKIISVAFLLVWLTKRRHANLHDLGWNKHHLPRDIRAGVGAFFMLVCPVMALQALLNQLKLIPGEHPIMKMWHDSPTIWQHVAILITAVVVAPLVEEFFFRVLVQGWLENVSFLLPRILEHRARHADSAANGLGQLRREESIEYLLFGGAPAQRSFATSSVLGELHKRTRRARYVPIICSSLLFATAHWGHGPAPIPLFLLSLGLGYLYQRTHRILPCIMVHMLLNSLSVSLLFFAEAPSGS